MSARYPHLFLSPLLARKAQTYARVFVRDLRFFLGRPVPMYVCIAVIGWTANMCGGGPRSRHHTCTHLCTTDAHTVPPLVNMGYALYGATHPRVYVSQGVCARLLASVCVCTHTHTSLLAQRD